MWQLEGDARLICRGLVVAQVSSANGKEVFLQTVRKSLIIAELDDERRDKAQRQFMKLRRRREKSINFYLTRLVHA